MEVEHGLYLDRQDPTIYKAMRAWADDVARVRAELGVDPKLAELVNIRVSQINGCHFCLDTHTRRARAVGEVDRRLDVLRAWRETDLFTEQERAALDFAEAVTELPPYEERVRREQAAREVLGDDVFALISWLAIAMSSFNRLSIISRHHLPKL
ncbi:MAG TPA: carboxymuconolactone decarboxylase family protein [Marmoricola sp.]|nr:carboxymuconolactone decarboxylase family protein [Marmoricola sp.]